MSALWSEEAKYRTWLDIEILACRGWHQIGKIPKVALDEILQNAHFEIETILKKEKGTGHDVAAFVSVVQESIAKGGSDAGRYFHMGLTSSDIVDTAQNYRLVQSIQLLQKELDTTLSITKKKALEYRDILTIGRTHGIHAEPLPFGLKFLRWYEALSRAKTRLEFAKESVAVGKLSGVVGTYSEAPPSVEEFVCKALQLKSEKLATQVVPRDRLCDFFYAVAVLASVVESIAVEIRHLQRTEVSELQEGFGSEQKGSSAMPHKRNPILAENLTGLSRILRSYLAPSLENNVLWHERDISHSSVERVLLKDACILTDFMLSRLNHLLEGLKIFPNKMASNLNILQGVIYSQKVLLFLLDKGMARDEAYAHVQRCSFEALEKRVPFQQVISNDRQIGGFFDSGSLDELFSAQNTLQSIDTIYQKVIRA